MNRVSPISRSHPARADAADGSVPHRYWAYLSYSHRDEADAKWLHEVLEKFTVPPGLVGRQAAHGPIPKSFAPIFRDRQELAASSDLGGEIRQALARSRFLIVLCSPAAAASHWTNEEIATFKRLHPDRRILAAIVAGEPWASLMPGREAEECFPPALRTHFDSRGRPTKKRDEPIAADLREGRDGRRMGMLKVAAGMLGVGLDDLVQRDAQRRQKRLKYIAAASLAGMTLTSGLAVFAFDRRDEARDQRREAEGLVGFMLGDLREKLEPIGRLDALDAVGTRALKYFESQDKSELSDDALAQRSKALALLGQISTARGDTDSALARYREAMRSTGELVQRAPDDPQRLFDHAQNVFWMGELARQRGRMDQAEAAYREYKALADRMVAIEPDNAKWRMEELYATENIGIVLYFQRRFAEAAREIGEAVPIMETLASKSPGNAEYQAELSNVIAWLADARRDAGRLDLAIAAREKEIALLRRALLSDRTNVQLQQRLIPAQQALGILLADVGQTERAIDQLRMAIRDAKALMAIEPQNATWKGGAAGAHLELAQALLSLRRTTEAQSQADAGCNLSTMLRERDPEDATWRMLLTNCQMVRSRLALAVGALPQALILSERSLNSARQERSADPVRDRYRIAAAFRLIGEIHRRMGDDQAALRVWKAGLAQLPAKVNERPREMHERAEILERLGRTHEARPLLGRLSAIDFKSTT
jgi:tetratricopeptide (TPR) repeat protein